MKEENSNMLLWWGAFAALVLLLVKSVPDGDEKPSEELSTQVKAFNKGSHWVAQTGGIRLAEEARLNQYTTNDLQSLLNGATDTIAEIPVLTLDGGHLSLLKGFFIGNLVGVRQMQFIEDGKVVSAQVLKIQGQPLFKPAPGSDGYFYTKDGPVYKIT